MANSAKRLLVTIDGPAGVGKTTMARRVARELGIAYLDTGAMFRTLALRLGEDMAQAPEEEIRERAGTIRFSLEGQGEETRILCNGTAVGSEIRTEEVGRLASLFAAMPVVREILKDAQKAMGQDTSLVVEGRDMGTVVFPDATCKIFLDADPAVRAKRRFEDLKAMGREASLAELESQIRERDERDRNRAVAPLKPAADAFIVDTSNLTREQVLQDILDCVARSPAGSGREQGAQLSVQGQGKEP